MTTRRNDAWFWLYPLFGLCVLVLALKLGGAGISWVLVLALACPMAMCVVAWVFFRWATREAE